MSIVERLLPEFDQEMKSTRKVLACVPEGKWDWKPHPKSMPLGVLTGHIADMSSWGLNTLEKDDLILSPGDYKPYVPASTEDLLKVFEEKQSAFREVLATTSDETFSKIWSMTYNGKKMMEMPKIMVIRGMVLNHTIHHRAQLGVYLRLLDISVPGVYGPSADEMAAFNS